MEASFPKFKTITIRTTDPTKIHIIKQSIPEPTTRIVDLTFLPLGFTLNIIIVLVIVSKSSMRTSPNIYFANLACSSFVILIEPLQKILRWFLDVNMNLNMDYVLLTNFDVSILTITMLNIQMYIDIFQRNSPLGQYMFKRTTALKGIVLIWSTCIVTIACHLHIYDFFKGVMDDIYVWLTFMFTILPCIIFFILESLILYELAILKAIEGSWRRKQLRDFLTLVSVTIAILLTLVPYRFARAINFIDPKASCCTDSKREVLYLIAKTFPFIFAIIYIIGSDEFHKALKEILCCRCGKSNEEAALTDT